MTLTYNTSMGNRGSLPPLVTVPSVAMPRFMGRWYVIAVKPTYFELGAVDPVETYVWSEEHQRIDIDFSFSPQKGAPLKRIPQKGYVHDKSSNAEWRVSPFWPLRLPYLVIELDDSPGDHPYQYTVIGYPSRAYMWVMAREPRMAPELLKELLGRAVSKHGYDLAGIEYPEHTKQSDAQ